MKSLLYDIYIEPLGDSDWMGPVICVLVWGVSIAVALALMAVCYEGWLRATHNCTRSHSRHVNDAHSFIVVGKVVVPMFEPAHDETVCDEWRWK